MSIPSLFEIGKDVQYFIQPMTFNATTGVWAASGPELPIQLRVDDVSISVATQSSNISPVHLFNSNPVIFEGGATVQINESRMATANMGAGTGGTGPLRGNVLETASRVSYTWKFTVKRFDKSGTEIPANRVTFMLQLVDLGNSNTKSQNGNSASLSTIALVNPATGLELANPYFGTPDPLPF